MRIRDVREQDAGAIAIIYGFHVSNGTASYDLEVPPDSYHRDKIRRISAADWPFIVAEVDGAVAGYAYVTQFRDRAAYRFTAEDSIYVHPDMVRQGIGRALLSELLRRSAQYGFKTVIAVIGGAEPSSIALHRGLGFDEVGRLRAVGWEHDRWLDSVYMQSELSNRTGHQSK